MKKNNIFVKNLKIMKIKTLSVFVLILIFSACTYYEHGPVMSLKSAKTRIAGQWELSDVIVNDDTDEVILNAEKPVIYSFGEDGSLELTDNSTTRQTSAYLGTWEFNDDKTVIYINFTSESFPADNKNLSYEILRLTDTELWISDRNCPDRISDYITERRYTKK
jgi:hypothetical protein